MKNKKIIIVKVILDCIKEKKYEEKLLLYPLKIPYGNFINEGLFKEDVIDIIETLKDSKYLSDGDHTATIEKTVKFSQNELSEYISFWSMGRHPRNYEEVKKILEDNVKRAEKGLQEFLNEHDTEKSLYIYPNIEKLNKLYKEYKKDNKIKEIYIFKGQYKYSLIIIGENGNKLIEPKLSVNKNSWVEGIYKIAQSQECEYSKNIEAVNNNKKLELYDKGYFDLTKILKKSGDKMRPSEKIKICRIKNEDEFFKKRSRHVV